MGEADRAWQRPRGGQSAALAAAGACSRAKRIARNATQVGLLRGRVYRYGNLRIEADADGRCRIVWTFEGVSAACAYFVDLIWRDR